MKKALSVFTLLASLVLCCFISFNALATTSPEAQSLAKAMEYYKNVLKPEFIKQEEPIQPNVWHLACLRSAKVDINSEEYSFMVPDYSNLSLDETEASSVYANHILGIVISGNSEYYSLLDGDGGLVNTLINRQNQAGEFPFVRNDNEISTINDNIWSVIALDNVNAEYNKNAAITAILNSANEDGGWAFYGTESDIDLTGMALLALSNHKDIEGVPQAIDKAVSFIHSCLQDDGFLLGNGMYATKNTNSQAYGIIGLIAAGEDIYSEKWTEGDTTIIDAMLRNQDKNGGFWYNIEDKDNPEAYFNAPDDYSTQQAVLALGLVVNGELPWDNKDLKIDINNLDLTPPASSTSSDSSTSSSSSTADNNGSEDNSENNVKTNDNSLLAYFAFIGAASLIIIKKLR